MRVPEAILVTALVAGLLLPSLFLHGEVPDHAVVAGAPARVVRRWDAEKGWQPPLRTPAPVPIPAGITPEQLLALGELELSGPELGDLGPETP